MPCDHGPDATTCPVCIRAAEDAAASERAAAQLAAIIDAMGAAARGAAAALAQVDTDPAAAARAMEAAVTAYGSAQRAGLSIAEPDARAVLELATRLSLTTRDRRATRIAKAIAAAL